MGLRDSIPAPPSPAGKAAAIVKVRAWDNQTVHVWAITSDEHAKFRRETERRRKRNPEKLRIPERFLILCLRDEHGVPHFTADDEDFLAGQPIAVIQWLFDICIKENGFGEDSEGVEGNP